MRKIYLAMLILFLTTISYAKINVFIDISTSFLKPADTEYAKIYGDKIFYPEIITGIKLFKDIYIFGAYGFLNIKGDIVDIGADVNASSKQSFMSFGIGYEFMAKKRISLKISGGIVLINYEERAYLSDILLDNYSGENTGYKLDMGLFYNFSKNFNISVNAGYFHSQNTTDNKKKLSFGGIKAGVGLGIKF